MFSAPASPLVDSGTTHGIGTKDMHITFHTLCSNIRVQNMFIPDDTVTPAVVDYDPSFQKKLMTPLPLNVGLLLTLTVVNFIEMIISK